MNWNIFRHSEHKIRFPFLYVIQHSLRSDFVLMYTSLSNLFSIDNSLRSSI
ncbi:hypothetical protein [Ehrlichia ruminantium]|uniref:hypothetical protein n=1 Tax=Ehrlichia ruminantium TaxID=779 RepID=UPI00130EB956|nr:hypothetical protein [Ehrlichia ruminantium]